MASAALALNRRERTQPVDPSAVAWQLASNTPCSDSRCTGEKGPNGHKWGTASQRGERWSSTSVRVVSRRKQIENGSISSVRQAAAACNVSPPVVRRWLSLGLIPGPPWTREQLQEVRERTDPEGRRRGTRAAHGTITRWNAGCSCTKCAYSKAPKLGHADDAERKRGCLTRNAGNSWRSSTAASPLGLCSLT